MMRIWLAFLSCWITASALAQTPSLPTPFERSKGLSTATFSELQTFYRSLCKQHPQLRLDTIGYTDGGHPLWKVSYCADTSFSWGDKRRDKVLVLVNNGIHAGEPDGIDASMMLLRDIAEGRWKIDKNVVLVVIPIFNVDGMINRREGSRANQNGPRETGFRASARNLDLNRDFMKMDASETQTLVHFFQEVDPEVFIDNHVSNGADYQHVMTLLTPHAKKQGKYLGPFLKNTLQPAVYAAMKKRGYDLIPYVNHWGHTPDRGWPQFYEPPRFASGFACLHQALAFVPETHMLKPFPQRVAATYDLMKVLVEQTSQHRKAILEAKAQERSALLQQTTAVLDWKVDTTQHEWIAYRGYAAQYKTSMVSGAQRLYYDRKKPYQKNIPFYSHFVPTLTARVPQAYLLPKAWGAVVHRLQLNGVELKAFDRDTTLWVTAYSIEDFETVKNPYEGHYLHYNIKVREGKDSVTLRAGDFYIPIAQNAKRYLLESMEPQAPDGFFAWNFFDAVLQQKEWFSDYVFEDEAAEMLLANPALQKELDEKKKQDPQWAKDPATPLYFLYQRSVHMEPGFKRYPVYRID